MPSLAKKRADLEATLKQDPPLETDPHSDVHGVLLSDEIAYYADKHKLITPFNRSNLKPAGYELTVGNEYFLHGEFLTLDDNRGNKDKITIPPFEVAVLRTGEVLCIPRFLIARWNIRVKHAYSGLLWVGGPQVDPGWVGQLSCPIYNLSDKPVTLRAGEPIAVIDFVKTSPYYKDNKSLERYPFPPKRLILEDYRIDELRSALFTKAGAKLVEFESQITNLESRFNIFTQTSFAIFALVFALAATAHIGLENVTASIALTGAATLALSVYAVLTSCFSYIHWRVGRLVYEQMGTLMENRAEEARRFLARRWWLGIVVSFAFALIGAGLIYNSFEPFLRDVRQNNVLTKTDLDRLNNSLSAKFIDLSERVEQLTSSQQATAQDLEALRGTVENKVRHPKSDAE